MRTTIDLDEDVLRVAKSLARERGQSIGRVISDLFRLALRPPTTEIQERNGVSLLPRRGEAQPVTSELVKELLDSDE